MNDILSVEQKLLKLIVLWLLQKLDYIQKRSGTSKMQEPNWQYIVPIPKVDNPSTSFEYRSISVLPVLSEFF